MNNDRQSERKVVCAVEKGYGSSESDVGKLRAIFEILLTGEIVPINTAEHFCDTEMVFVTGQFSEIEEKFGERLFEARCIPSNFQAREGDCRYVTRAQSCAELKGLVCSQVFDTALPSASDAEFVSTQLPITKTLLIRNDDFVYGPFEYEFDTDDVSGNYKYKLKAISTPINNAPTYHIGKVSSHQCIQYLSEKDDYRAILGNVKRCFEHSEAIDYITDDQILSTYGSKIAQNSQIRSFNKGTIVQIRKAFSTSVDQRKFPHRFERLFGALEAASCWEGTRKELVDNFLNTDSGRKILESYIESNKDEFFKDEKQQYQKNLETEHEEANRNIRELTEKKDQIEADIRKFQREREEMELDNESSVSVETLSLQEREKLDSALEEKRIEFGELEEKVKELSSKYSRFETMEAIEQEIKDLERDKDRVQGRHNEMTKQVEAVATQLRTSNEELTSRLLKLKPDVDALSGIAAKPVSQTVDFSVSVKIFDSNKSDDEIRDGLIQSVDEALSLLGRKTDYNSVANILTTIAQSQFTLFSGKPGTGKTSLAKMLGRALGLGNRFLNVPVARGWTSSRDVLGFYNALSSSFNSSATGLYELLSKLSEESKSGEDSAAAICLLDEFNLSQPEHYFSPFLEMADSESKRIIATGDQNSPYLSIPKYLRFLGTINNDESVQALTPRMLDRSAIINFDGSEPDYDLSLTPDKNIEELNVQPISGSKLIEAFSPRSLDLPQDIDRALKLIVENLSTDNPELGTPVSISFRKIKAIRSYHNVTSSMYIGSRYTALDYAVSQHILPLLNGYGENFGKRLLKLVDVIPDEMEITHGMLKRLISSGSMNMFTYGFGL